MSDSKMYNILGIFKGLTNTKTEQLNESVNEPIVYENVEPKGSITEAVKSLESKYATFKEAKAKPDFLDVDKDGNKAEPFKKAVKDKEAKQVDEGQGPYELSNPKHPKFKANHDKWMKKNPGKKLADFVAAMKKKEAAMNEAAYDEPAAPDAEAIAKRKRLQALKDRQEDDRVMGGKDETNTPIRKVAGKAYGGAAQKDAPEADDLEEETSATGGEITKKGNVTTHKAKKYGGEEEQDRREKDIMDRKSRYSVVDVGDAPDDLDESSDEQKLQRYHDLVNQGMDPDDAQAQVFNDEDDELDEVAPPGAKAERMVKHIKKGYSKDGKLSKKEKGIAYATAWKAHNKGQVEEGTEFKDTIANSKAEMKKAKPAMVKEGRVMEETDYFYEKIGRALAEQNPHLDTATGEFVDAVRKEMVAQGIPPNRARNILLMDEDFLSDVATSYAHCCKEVAEAHAPINSHLGGVNELDEIAALAGLPTRTSSTCESCGCESCQCTTLDEAATRKDFRMVANLIKQIPDSEKRKELAHHHAGIFKQQNPRFKHDVFCKACNVDECGMAPAAIIVGEEEVDEGNEFTKARLDAIAAGSDTFRVGSKTYNVSGDTSDEKVQVEESKQTVTEDINVNITANGEEDALNLFRKLAGMAEVPQVTGVAIPVEEEYCDACDSTECHCGEAVEEERDIELANTPHEEVAPVSAVTTDAGGGLGGPKKQYPAAANRGANPIEESLWANYEEMINDIKV